MVHEHGVKPRAVAPLGRNTTQVGGALAGKVCVFEHRSRLTPAVRALEPDPAEYLVAANQTAAYAGAWLAHLPAATERQEKATAARRSKGPQSARARSPAR